MQLESSSGDRAVYVVQVESYDRELCVCCQVESSYEDVYTVLFVDYGHTETTRLARVRPLVSMFCSQPPFAIQCALAGLEPVTGGRPQPHVT